MKCPKCGYNSFDHLESCKKCSNDLVGHKAKFGLRSLFFAERHSEAPLSEPSVETEPEYPSEEQATVNDPSDSGFDFMPEQEDYMGDPSEASLDGLLGGEESLEMDEDFLREEAGPAPVSFVDASVDGPSLDDGTEGASDIDFAWDEEPPAASLEVATDGFELDLDPAEGLMQEDPPDFDSVDEASSGDRKSLLEGIKPEGTEDFQDWNDSGTESAGTEGAEELFDPLSDADFSFEEDPGGGQITENEDSISGGGEDRKAESLLEENLAELFLDSLDEPAVSDEFSPGDFPPGGDLPFLGNDPFGEDPFLPSAEVTQADSERAEDDAEEGREKERTVSEGEGETPPPLTARLGAGAADVVILGLVFVLFVAAGEMGLSTNRGGGIFPTVETLLELAIPYFLVLFAVFFGYFTLFHFLIGQTPGKMFFRLRVEGEQGGGLLFSQAFLRSVGGLLSLLPAGVGFLRIVLDGERRGWNDRLANSRVVRVAGCREFEETAEGALPEEI